MFLLRLEVRAVGCRCVSFIFVMASSSPKSPSRKRRLSLAPKLLFSRLTISSASVKKDRRFRYPLHRRRENSLTTIASLYPFREYLEI
ncbi:MAG: hypothetical protein K2G85_09935 [Muribaculaceae bacterium]|nr:hypothetical protein [Muribaculaceae bacterium]